jgi:class 3 adenylate cyclase/TolB-like protein
MERQEPAQPLVKLKAIGSIAAVDTSGRDVLPASHKARALLAYLAYNAGEWLPRSRLTRLLWDRVPEEEGRVNLVEALHELSRSLGAAYPELVEAEQERLRVRAGSLVVDALVLSASTSAEFGSTQLLDGFDDLSDEFDDWLASQRQILENQIRRGAESNVQAHDREPIVLEERVEAAREAVAFDPTNEEAVRDLMQALVDAGQRTQAVLAYKRCRALSRSRLNRDPSAETQALYQSLRRAPRQGQAMVSHIPPAAKAQHLRHLNRGVRAILFVDVAESVRLIAADEEGIIGRWLDFVQDVAAEILPRTSGRMVKSLGDGMLLEFADARSAAAAAFSIQALSRQRNESVIQGQQMLLRMGIEVGDIIVGDVDVYGHSVNLAARLMTTLAAPGEIVITANARDQLTPVLDADVVDLGNCYLKNIDGPVRAYRIGPPGPRYTSPLLEARQLLASIAVIPFASRLSPPEHDVLGEVLADELIHSLSRSHKIDVIARLSTTVFRGRSASIAEIGTHLHADYVLSGVYRTENQSIILDLELAEVYSERIIWNERLHDKIADILDTGHELVNRIVGEVYNAIVSQELKRASGRPLPTLESYTLLMSGIALMHRMSLRDFMKAREMLTAIIERGTRQAAPHAWLAKWYVLRIQQGWTENIQRDTADALRCTTRALEYDPNSSLALAIDGLVNTHMTRRHDIAESRYALAVQHNPNDALAWLLKGTHHAFKGEGQQAVENTERALRLSPLDPHGYYYHTLTSSAHITAGNNELALEHAQWSLRANRSHTSTLRVKAVAQWRLGRHEEARKTGQELIRLEPKLTVTAWLKRSPSAPYAVGRSFAKTLEEIGIPP